MIRGETVEGNPLIEVSVGASCRATALTLIQLRLRSTNTPEGPHDSLQTVKKPFLRKNPTWKPKECLSHLDTGDGSADAITRISTLSSLIQRLSCSST